MRQNHSIFCSLSETTTVSYQCWRLAEQIERKKSDSTMHNMVVVNDWKIKIIPILGIQLLFYWWMKDIIIINNCHFSKQLVVQRFFLFFKMNWSFLLFKRIICAYVHHTKLFRNKFQKYFLCIEQRTTIKTVKITALQHFLWKIKV